jgi:L-aminopeptidase/D-esterase-like protein
MTSRPRARESGIPLEGDPGENNAITDVAGVEVGYSTIIEGSGALRVGHGPVRTGVTAILPRGKASSVPVFAGWFSLNGNGEMTGTTWIEESGFLEGPVMLTNTHSVGVVRDAVVAWQARTGRLYQEFSNPIVAETYDGQLNDINGFHVKSEHAIAALEAARSGPIAEGNVGGGTGMVCFQFKGGTGTASRRCRADQQDFTVGVLVQANFGLRRNLVVAGVPVGKAIPMDAPSPRAPSPSGAAERGEQGSIIVVVATDAPLLPHQLKRLARRASMGLARTGGIAGNGSGDIFVAFSTANPSAAPPVRSREVVDVRMLTNDFITPLFEATVYATEEAILNALFAAETMTGIDDRIIEALPIERVRELFARERVEG